MYVGGSIIFVMFYMTIHTKSFFLASIGMLMILLSFPVSVFIYYFVFRISMFTAMHTLTLFIVLGISADNIFVFFDAWQ